MMQGSFTMAGWNSCAMNAMPEAAEAGRVIDLLSSKPMVFSSNLESTLEILDTLAEVKAKEYPGNVVYSGIHSTLGLIYIVMLSFSGSIIMNPASSAAALL